MTVTVDYNKIGKGIAVDGSTKQTFYGADFNPSPFSRPSSWSSVTATNVTTSFDLGNFQPGHEVGCGVFVLSANASHSGTLWADFERYDGSWSFAWDYSWYYDVDSSSHWAAYIYFGVDDDEIRPGYSKYRIHYYTVDNTVNFYSPEFTVSSLSIDSSRHRAGYLWVQGSHLCYTDGTWGSTGYKHSIAFDSSYSGATGADKGYIRLENNDNYRIYYIDATGTERRTYSSEERYGGNENVGTSNKGYMWVSNGGMADGYGHLCFVAPNGSKRRILNGPAIGYS